MNFDNRRSVEPVHLMTDNSNSIKVMLVDDSAIIRGLIKRMIDPEPDLEVVASVGNGELAVKRLGEGGIDVIVLDIEMPVMDGLTALPKLLQVDPKVKIIMASTLTLENAEISIEAMKMGAADYVPKPTSTAKIGGASDFRDGVISKIKALGNAKLGRRTFVAPGPQAQSTTATSTAAPEGGVSKLMAAVGDVKIKPISASFPPSILAIGSSTGGPQALFKLLKGLAAIDKVPVVIAQHMPASFTTILAKHIASTVNRPCTEGVDGDVIKPGHVYLAPGDYHMIVEKQGAEVVLRLNQEPPENFCRPAVDPMFRSIASVYGGRALSVVLTGMGSDGSRGAKVISDAGGTVLVQDEASSVVWGMPSATAALGICSAILPLDDLSSAIDNVVAKGRL